MFPETEKWTITFKEREAFNKMTDLGDMGAYDVGHSDMTLIFDNEEQWLDAECAIIWNHYKENIDFTVDGRVSGKEYS